MEAIATRPTLQISIGAFVEAPRNASNDHAAFEQTLVFEFEEDEFLEEHDEAYDDSLPSLQDAWQHPTGLIANEVYDLVASQDEASLSLAELSATLASLGHGVLVRRGLGTHDVSKAARTLRYEFVVLYRYGDVVLDEELIIEPHFRARFELLSSNSSSAYRSMLAALPDIFVGRLKQLVEVVHLAAAYLGHEYRRLGRAVPPWRTASALLSRWAPEHSQDVMPGALSPTVSDAGTYDRSSTCDRSLSFTSYDGSPVCSPTSVLPFYGKGSAPVSPPAVQPVYGFSTPAATASGAKDGVAQFKKGAGPEYVSEVSSRVHGGRLAPKWFVL